VSPSWRDDLRVSVCPRRLVLARYRRALRRRLIESAVVPIEDEPAAELARLAGKARVTVVLSNHFVRYALLPPTRALRSRDEWSAYARHTFASTFGEAARSWEVRLCSTGFRHPRLACAVESSLLSSLRAVSGVVSIQPYLMSAFNERRGRLPREAAWFVLQEEGRLTFALIAGGAWRLVRSRQANGDWQSLLPELLDREIAASGEPGCDRVFLCAESEAPASLGGYRVTDMA